MLLDHPDSFRDGVRTVWLKSRNKDGAAHKRMLSRITHSADHHRRVIEELHTLARPGERIYSNLDARDVMKAARYFQHQIIDSQERETFWTALPSGWESALMQPSSRSSKLWLWDCDTPAEADAAQRALPGEHHVYTYDTRSGVHVITRPFDLRALEGHRDVMRLRKDNAMMLWGFDADPPRRGG